MTPQLLELSGIGQKSVLDKFGIQTMVELQVGENLQDHVMLSLEFSLNQEAQCASSFYNLYM
jgi:choline dehydrogenase-like flavoprotein